MRVRVRVCVAVFLPLDKVDEGIICTSTKLIPFTILNSKTPNDLTVALTAGHSVNSVHVRDFQS